MLFPTGAIYRGTPKHDSVGKVLQTYSRTGGQEAASEDAIHPLAQAEGLSGGERVTIRTSSPRAHKGAARRALHRAAVQGDGPLRRRTRTGNAAQLPAGSRLVGNRIKVPLVFERGPDKVWIYGALCVRDGQTLTQTAPSRNTTGYLALLQTLNQAYPQDELYLIADNLASHLSGPIRDWLAGYPRHHRIQHALIPVGVAWLNLIEGWWVS